MSISKHEVFNFCFMNQNIMLLCYIENGGACYFLFGESAQIVLYVLIMSLHFFPVATDRTTMSFTFSPSPFLFSIWPMEMIHKDINNMLKEPIQQCEAVFSRTRITIFATLICCDFTLYYYQINANTISTPSNQLCIQINVYEWVLSSIHSAE